MPEKLIITLTFTTEEISEIYSSLGYVQGILIGIRNSVNEIEGDTDTIDAVVGTVRSLSSLLSSKFSTKHETDFPVK